MIGTGIPDISPLAAVAALTWRQLGEQLRRVGFDDQYLEGVWQSRMRAHEASLQRPVLIWHVRRRRDPGAYAYRMFILRDPVTDSEAAEVLGENLLGILLDAGMLIRPESDCIVSVLDFRVFRGLLIFCDDLSHRGEAVFGVGPGTAAFCGLPAKRGIVSSALELGCGAGGAALWLSRHAGRVVATDINPRALEFVKINAAVNQITNIETRSGDLFESVAGETFDFIVSQPPYVPAAPSSRAATYLFGGPKGSELVSRIVAELPPYVSEGGRAVIVFEQQITDESGSVRHEPVFACREDMRILVLLGAEVNADAYSIRHASPELRRGIEEYDRVAIGMRTHLCNLGIRGLCPAICVLERAPELSGWTETVRVGDGLWDEVCTETIERLLTGRILLHQRAERILSAKIRIPEGSLVVQPYVPNGGKSDKVFLGLPSGYLPTSVEFSQVEWEVLKSLGPGEASGAPSDIVAKAARTGLLDA